MDAAALRTLGIAPETAAYVDARNELIRIGRTLRADYGIAPGQKVDYAVRVADAATAARLESDRETIVSMLRAGRFDVGEAFAPKRAMPSGLGSLGTIYMSLEGVIDIEAELKRLHAQLAEADGHLERITRKLENMDFVSKAPAAVVEQQRASRQQLLEKREKLLKLIETLSGS